MDVITEMRADCPCSGMEYCPLAEFIRHLPERTLVQHKCVEVMKWKISKERGADIGWDEAYHIWVDNGYAASFAAAWRPGLSHSDVLHTLGV